MRHAVTSIATVLLTFNVWSQSPPAQPTDVVRLVQNLKASSFDQNLPKVTLEFFLNYEAAGSRVEWKESELGRNGGY